MILEPPSPAGMRRDYAERGAFLETDLAADWTGQFAAWFAEAAAYGLPEPNAMIVATAGRAGRLVPDDQLLGDVHPDRVGEPAERDRDQVPRDPLHVQDAGHPGARGAQQPEPGGLGFGVHVLRLPRALGES